MKQSENSANSPSAETGVAPEIGPGCGCPDPIGAISEEHALLRELCDVLEAIADGLPHSFDRHLAEVALSILENSLPSHIRLEEDALFPLLRQRLADNQSMISALECLEAEHDRDAAMLDEITNTLRSVFDTGTVGNPEILGYVLRGFFESQRRHIAWEDTVILPLARRILTAGDLSALQDWIMRSERPLCWQQTLIAITRARSSVDLRRGCAGSTAPAGSAGKSYGTSKR